MRAILGILLLAAAARAQEGGIPASGAPKTEKPVPPAAGRGAAPAAAPAAAARSGGTAPAGGGLSPKDLKYPPLRTIQAPNPTTFTLANGMKVYLLEDHELPLVGGIALIRTGSFLDPPEKIGLAQLAGITIRSGGTILKTGEQIESLLDSSGSTVESVVGDSIGTMRFAALKEDAAATLQLFKEMLTQPAFRREKVDLAKAQLRTTIARRNDAAGTIAHRELADFIYGKDTPFGWAPEYTTIDRISRNDLRAFHQRYYFPANIMVGVWGDFDSAEMKAAIEKLFADWTVQQPPVPEFPKVKKTTSAGLFLAEKKDARQAFVAAGHLGGLRNDKDFAALEILAQILGGLEGRVNRRLRAKLSIDTDVAATWDGGYAGPGLFEIRALTKPTSTVGTIQAIQEEIERIRTADVTEEEWRNARDQVANRFAFAHDSKAKVMSHQIVLEYYGYPKDYLTLYQKALQSATRADLLRVAKQALNPANLTVVVAANPGMFGEPLEKLGTVTKIDLAIPEAKPGVMERSDSSLAEGKKILLQAQEAAGGAERLAAVKDYTMLSEYTIDPLVPNMGGSKLVQTEKWVAPAAFRQDSTLPAGRVSVYTDGNVGWVSSQQGWGALSGAQRSRAFGDLFRVYYRLLLSDRLEGRVVNAIDESSVQIADSAGQVTNVEFDPRTHLIKRLSYDEKVPGSMPIYTEEFYDDYRDAGGIKVPFKINSTLGGRRYTDMVVKDYKINTGLNPLELARRPQ